MKRDTENVATKYFESIFMPDQHLDPTPIVDLVTPLVGDLENEALCAEFTDKEIVDSCSR